MKLELKTENKYSTKSFLYIFSPFFIIAIIIIFTNISLKLGNISRQFEINYLCRILTVDKSKSNFKKLSKFTNIKNNIFHFSVKPKNTSEGIVVMNAIGITTLKNTLREKENDDSGNLPMYRNDLNTSVAFHVLTNQIVVVEMKNHKL